MHAEELAGVEGKGTRLLQISRSTPLVTAALIGHKQVGMPGGLGILQGWGVESTQNQATALRDTWYVQAANADLNIRLTAHEPLDTPRFYKLMDRLKSA